MFLRNNLCLKRIINPFRGLKDHLICQSTTTLNGDTREAACQVYSQNAWEAMTEGSGGERPWIEYGYYPDFVAYWLAIWACCLFAEQHTVNLNIELNYCILHIIVK